MSPGPGLTAPSGPNASDSSSDTAHVANPTTLPVSLAPRKGVTTTTVSVQRSPVVTSPTSVSPSASAWHSQSLPQGAVYLNDVSCSGSNECMAVGDSVITTADGGTGWQVRTMPSISSSDYLASLSCVSSSSCWVDSNQGRLFHTSDGGTSWSDQTPANVQSLGAIACLQGGDCMVTGIGGPSPQGPQVWYTTDGGATWGSTRFGYSPFALSCTTAITCTLVGGCNQSGICGAVTHDGGKSWTSEAFPGVPAYSALTGISCPDSTHCVAVGVVQSPNAQQALVFYTSDGGATWNAGSAPTNPDQLYSVSCFSVESCVAVGPYVTSTPGTSPVAEVVASSDSGVHWTTEYSAPSELLRAVDCVGSGSCWGVGSTQKAGTPNSATPAYVVSNH